MPYQSPHICGCGHVIAHGIRCICDERRARERNARYEASRPSARERGYTPEWDRERVAFLKANPVCRRPGCNAPATVVDHIEPHKGNMRLFWSRSNWQPLCTSCHSRWKQIAERRTVARNDA
jgi:5-methylcytosine-specific restriction endonuclease McrA